jgi:hypothetical protein
MILANASTHVHEPNAALRQSSAMPNRSEPVARYVARARPNADVVPLRPYTTRPLGEQPSDSIAQLQADLSRGYSSICDLQGDFLYLRKQPAQTNTQAHYAQSHAAQRARANNNMAHLPSTYIVPERPRNRRFDHLVQSIPHFILLTLSVSAFSLAIAASIPSLWPFVQAFLTSLISCLFLVIALSTLGSFILEVCLNHSA